MQFPWTPPRSHPLEDPSGAVRLSLRRLAASVAIAQGLVSTGRRIELDGIDSVTGLLCAQLLDLDVEDGIALRPTLEDLDASVENLIGSLKAARKP